MYYETRWKPYVSVAKRKEKAKRHANKLAKEGHRVLPVEITGRKIATTFWGTAWCDNLESYSDFENRLPRGRTYVRNGSVIDLQIQRGCVTAIISGSEIYEIKIDVSPVNKAYWKKIKQDCSRSIDSLIDLLQGRFAKGVMERLTRQEGGLFPKPKEISVRCSCPDWAVLCKHAAAALYGIGARLDSSPEMLFLLRGVDHLDLINQAVDGTNLDAAFASGNGSPLASKDLGELFGIDIEAPGDESNASPSVAGSTRRSKAARSKPNTTKATNNAKRTTRSGGQRKGAASVGINRSAKKKASSQITAAAKSKPRPENGKPKPRNKK